MAAKWEAGDQVAVKPTTSARVVQVMDDGRVQVELTVSVPHHATTSTMTFLAEPSDLRRPRPKAKR